MTLMKVDTSVLIKTLRMSLTIPDPALTDKHIDIYDCAYIPMRLLLAAMSWAFALTYINADVSIAVSADICVGAYVNVRVAKNAAIDLAP